MSTRPAIKLKRHKLDGVHLDSLTIPGEYGDGEWLSLQVKKGGEKIWNIQYRFAGKRGNIRIGCYPEVSLQKARTIRNEIRKDINRGLHPQDQKQQIKIKQQQYLKSKEENIFEKIAERWYKVKKRNVKKENAEKYWSSLQKHILPVMGKRHITDLVNVNREWIALFSNIAENPTNEKKEELTYTSFERLPTLIGQIFIHAINEGIITHNPIPVIKKALPNHKQKNMARITNAQLPQFLQALENYNPSNPRTRWAIWLLLYTGQRQVSIYNARWQDFDLAAKIWRRQPEKKDTEILLLPLPDQAVAILKELQEETYQNNPNNLVFPIFGKDSSDSNPISKRAISIAIKSMGFEMTGHGIRGLVSTELNELGFDYRLVEKQLGHTLRGAEKVYNTAKYFEQRREMMQKWADHLDALLNPIEQDPESIITKTAEEAAWEDFRETLELSYFERSPYYSYPKYHDHAKQLISNIILNGGTPTLTIDEFVLKMAKNEHKAFFVEKAAVIDEQMDELKNKYQEVKKSNPNFPLTVESIRALKGQLAAEAIFGWKSSGEEA